VEKLKKFSNNSKKVEKVNEFGENFEKLKKAIQVSESNSLGYLHVENAAEFVPY